MIHAFQPRAAEAVIGDTIWDARDPGRLQIDYRIDRGAHWIACTFADEGMGRDRLVLASVETSAGESLDGTRLHMLRLWLRLAPATVIQRATAPPHGPPRALAYASQQVVNALSNAAVYALLAVGFTMIYAVLGKMFLAFGQVMMTGAFGAIIAGGLAAEVTAGETVVLVAALAGAIGVAVAFSLAIGRLLDGVLRATDTQAALIASIGLLLALQEFVRLTQGAREIWLHRPFPQRIPLFEAGGFDVSAGASTLVIIGMATAVFGFVAALMRTRFGRAYRACTDDRAMAALVGVRVSAVIWFVMLIGGGAAGTAGAIVALNYGGIGFYTGAIIGLKALTAAIVGGIGSIGGAALGGLLIAVIETVTVGYLSPAYKDIAVFVILVAVLIWRPRGLAGRPQGRGD